MAQSAVCPLYPVTVSYLATRTAALHCELRHDIALETRASKSRITYTTNRHTVSYVVLDLTRMADPELCHKTNVRQYSHTRIHKLSPHLFLEPPLHTARYGA